MAKKRVGSSRLLPYLHMITFFPTMLLSLSSCFLASVMSHSDEEVIHGVDWVVFNPSQVADALVLITALARRFLSMSQGVGICMMIAKNDKGWRRLMVISYVCNSAGSLRWCSLALLMAIVLIHAIEDLRDESIH